MLLPDHRTNLESDSKAQTERISRERLLKHLGGVPEELMLDVDSSIGLHLGLMLRRFAKKLKRSIKVTLNALVHFFQLLSRVEHTRLQNLHLSLTHASKRFAFDIDLRPVLVGLAFNVSN